MLQFIIKCHFVHIPTGCTKRKVEISKIILIIFDHFKKNFDRFSRIIERHDKILHTSYPFRNCKSAKFHYIIYRINNIRLLLVTET